MPKNKIAILFPDGVGIRNYLYSDVFKNRISELLLFHNFDKETERDIKEQTGIEYALRIPKYNESAKEKFLRELICLSRLRYNTSITNNQTILTNWKSKHPTVSKKIFYKVIECLSLFTSKYKTVLKLEEQYQKAIRVSPYYLQVKDILQELKPDKLFCSHQRGLSCATIFAVASDLGIPTTTVIFSWDNLPKARLALRADNYLVWSDYMKQEMKMYYPEILQDNVHVTGTPQFEFYQDSSNIIPKEDFYGKYKLDPAKKTICYSGDDILTSPDDPKYLQDLAEELIKHNLESDYQILLRRCPVDLSGRFEPVIQKYPDLIKEAPPVWNFKDKSNWTTIYPLYEDVKLLVSTAYYCDIVVNVGSTMAFDFGMFDKPCIYINYDQEEKINPGWSVKTIYQFQHFRSMSDKDAVLWWNRKEEFVGLLQKKHDISKIKKWTDIILSDYKNSSVKIKKMYFKDSCTFVS